MISSIVYQATMNDERQGIYFLRNSAMALIMDYKKRLVKRKAMKSNKIKEIKRRRTWSKEYKIKEENTGHWKDPYLYLLS